MHWDQWGPSEISKKQTPSAPQQVVAARGLVVEDATSGFTGAILRMKIRRGPSRRA